MNNKTYQLAGSVDRFDPPRTIWGWIIGGDPDQKGRDIQVHVRREGRIIAKGPLLFPRPDIIKDDDYFVGFRLNCEEEVPDEVFALGLLSIEATSGDSDHTTLPLYDRARSFAFERAFLVAPAMGRYCASMILTFLSKSKELQADARAALRELNDKFFEEEDRKLLYQIESLGKDCSVGSMHRAYGAEPLGLWRFSGIGVDQVTSAIGNRLSGIGSPEYTQITKDERGEYYTKDTRYHMSAHTFTFEGTVEYEDFYRKQCQKLRFLARNLLEKLEVGDRLLVVHAIPDVIPDFKLTLLLDAISKLGPSTLLYLQLADEANPAGTVTRRNDGILIGYVLQIQGEMMRPETEVREGWMTVFRRARTIMEHIKGINPSEHATYQQ